MSSGGGNIRPYPCTKGRSVKPFLNPVLGWKIFETRSSKKFSIWGGNYSDRTFRKISKPDPRKIFQPRAGFQNGLTDLPFVQG